MLRDTTRIRKYPRSANMPHDNCALKADNGGSRRALLIRIQRTWGAPLKSELRTHCRTAALAADDAASL